MAVQWSSEHEKQDALLLLCRDLISCVNKIMDPLSIQAERAECSQKVEQFKDESPYCLTCGFILSEEHVPVIKHFGLQLMEHFVKYRWRSLSLDEGREFQLNLLQFLSNKLLPYDQEPTFVKEALARVTVETAKKMWPQRWDSFITDLGTVSKCGSTQVELVLLIFRRLAEDIHGYESGMTSGRKREMAAALNQQSQTVFTFLISNLESPLSEPLRRTALSTIVSFVEWVEFPTLLMEDAKLIKLLYNLIGVEELKTVACECLLPILSRKGDVRKTEGDRTTILSLLLSTEALNGIMAASILANSQGVVEEQYVFLKRVCQVLVHLGTSQLALLWTYSLTFKPPEALELYLQVVAEFTKHNSQLLSLTSADVWITFLSHNHLKDHPVFKDHLTHLLTIARQKLLKVGDPDVYDHVSSEYSRLDFDGADNFMLFFATFRGKMVKILSQVSLLVPRTAAVEALTVTEQMVQKKLEPGQGSGRG
ncbi:exportin-5-like [Halichondria panicea]|uniref:exportin-5-like n=1 Tax=Halichondria panicea TaxID=6063 RepID=UPI00312B7D8F